MLEQEEQQLFAVQKLGLLKGFFFFFLEGWSSCCCGGVGGASEGRAFKSPDEFGLNGRIKLLMDQNLYINTSLCLQMDLERQPKCAAFWDFFS